MKNNSKNKRIIFWSIFSPLLAGLTVWAVLKTSRSVSVSDLARLTAEANKLYLFAALLCAFLFIYLEGVAVRTVLKGTGYSRGFVNGLLYSVSNFYFSAITPSATGGQPASAYFMILDGIPAGVTTAVLILNVMMYTISNVLLGITAIIIRPTAFTGFGAVSKTLIIAGFAALSLLSLFFLIVLKKGTFIFDIIARFLSYLHRRKIIHTLSPKLEKLEQSKEHYRQCTDLISGKHAVVMKTLFWNFIQRASQAAVPMLLYLSLGGSHENAPIIFSRQCLVTVGYTLVPVPGALGIADFLMVDGFSGLIGRERAFELEMLSRGITFYFCLTVCAILTLIGYIVKKKKTET